MSSGFEISGWFKEQPFDQTDFRTITGKESGLGSTARNWWIATRADGKLWWKSSVSSGTAIDLTNSINVCDGTWHYFSAVHNVSTARLFVDGVPVASQASPGTVSIQNAPVQFGEEFGGSRLFFGQLDEIRISKVPRSTNWVWASYQTIASNTLFSTIGAISSVSLIGTNLTGSIMGNSLQLVWPPDHLGWRLQVQTNQLTKGLGTNWVDIASSTTTNQLTVPIITTNGAVFYRIAYP